MQLPCAMFHNIETTVNSLKNFENTIEVPCANLLERQVDRVQKFKEAPNDNNFKQIAKAL